MTEHHFKQAIAAAGLPPPDAIIADGKIHRFSTNGKARDESGWYVLHPDGVHAGSFGDWRTGLTQTWCSKSDTEMTAAEMQAHRDRIKAMQAARDQEKAQHHQRAAQAAEAALKAAEPAQESHPYLVKKGIRPHGTMVDKAGFLLVPRWPVQIPPPVASPNSPRQDGSDYGDSGLMAMRAAASLRR